MEKKDRIKLYEEAREQTMKSLPDFIGKLTEIQETHETSPEIVAAIASASAFANKIGITGFQANFSMWRFIQEWMYQSNKAGLRLINFDNMLYPQYEGSFEKTISSKTWKAIQEEAARKLKNDSAAEIVIQHWKSIVDGKVPFGYTIEDDNTK